MPKNFEVQDKDHGFKRIMASLLGGMTQMRAQVGIQADDGAQDHGGATNILVGMVHEFGSPSRNIPQRSFLRQTFDDQKAKYMAAMNVALARIADGRSNILQELTVIGEVARSDVIARIRSNIPPPWAESTQERKDREGKGGDPALWDTGQLVNSIRSVVK